MKTHFTVNHLIHSVIFFTRTYCSFTYNLNWFWLREELSSVNCILFLYSPTPKLGRLLVEWILVGNIKRCSRSNAYFLIRSSLYSSRSFSLFISSAAKYSWYSAFAISLKDCNLLLMESFELVCRRNDNSSSTIYNPLSFGPGHLRRSVFFMLPGICAKYRCSWLRFYYGFCSANFWIDSAKRQEETHGKYKDIHIRTSTEVYT